MKRFCAAFWWKPRRRRAGLHGRTDVTSLGARWRHRPSGGSKENRGAPDVCGACGCCLFSDWLAVGVTSPDPSRPPFLHRHLYLSSSSFFTFGIWRDSFRDSYDGILRHAYLFIYFLFGSKEKKEKSRKIRNVVWRPRRNLMIINIKRVSSVQPILLLNAIWCMKMTAL